jgi:hypothetical protein
LAATARYHPKTRLSEDLGSTRLLCPILRLIRTKYDIKDFSVDNIRRNEALARTPR